MRMAMRHPVVQHNQRLQFVSQGPQVVSMYPQQQAQPQQQQQQWIMNGQPMQRPRPPHQQQHPQPQLQFQPGQQPMRMRQVVPPQSVMPPQQHQPPFVTPTEIAYNVEHVFNENGREVRKMPIKMGDETIWVDCVESGNAVGDQQVCCFVKLKTCFIRLCVRISPLLLERVVMQKFCQVYLLVL
jgi:hypothetical protein